MLCVDETIQKAMAFPMEEVIRYYADNQDLPLDVAEEHARELKRFLALAALSKRPYGIRGPIDELWHTFVLFTKSYATFCQEVAGRFIHHIPNVTWPDRPRYRTSAPPDPNRNVKAVIRGYRRFLRDYEAKFGEPAPVALWPRPTANEFAVYTGGSTKQNGDTTSGGDDDLSSGCTCTDGDTGDDDTGGDTGGND